MATGRAPRPLKDRILESIAVNPETGCWEWTKSRNQMNYGRMYVGSRADGTRRNAHAHRVAYEVFIGPIPEGKYLDHLCRNPPCVNPEHLEPVTSRENTIVRGVGGAADQARQTHCKRGHEFTPENTYIHRNKRYCRECLRARNRAYQARRQLLAEG